VRVVLEREQTIDREQVKIVYEAIMGDCSTTRPDKEFRARAEKVVGRFEASL